MNLLKDGLGLGAIIETQQSRKITIDGHTDVYKVYKVKLDYLFYNDQNDRIATWISQYKADNNVNKMDMSNMKQYNSIIHDFITKSNPGAITKTQANIELFDQRESGVILADGRIIDGNRRFTCLRNLFKDKPNKFGYFETVILEKDIENNLKQIKMLELMIQHGEEIKVDYNPIDRLVGIYNDIIDSKLLSIKEYANSTNTSESEVNKQVELSKLLVEFLETINAPKQFHIARDMDLNGPLHELYGILKKVKNEEQVEDIKSIAFINFLMQPHGDMTRFIRKIKTVANSKYIDEFIEEQLDIAEKVIDKLPEVGQVNKKVINEVFRGDEKVKEELRRSLEKVEFKAKSSESRNRPLAILEKVGDSLDTIDINIFDKLNEEQLSSFISQIEKIEEKLNDLKGCIDV